MALSKKQGSDKGARPKSHKQQTNPKQHSDRNKKESHPHEANKKFR
jgi:hypothetical protein